MFICFFCWLSLLRGYVLADIGDTELFTWDLDSSEVPAEIFPEGFMILVWEQLQLALYERSSSQNW